MAKNKNQKVKAIKQLTKRNKGKKTYKVRNWHDYNESLKQRGAIDVWINEESLNNWQAKPSFKPGAQAIYSDLAIQVTLQFGKVFHQKLRQTEGLMQSIFKQIAVNLPIPDYSTLSRRSGLITVKVPKESKKGEKLIIVVDSTGLKVFGEGEWKVRQHGYSKRRTWRKAHLGITPDGEIRMALLTENDTADCEVFKQLLSQEEADIDSLAGDGGYDKEIVYAACQNKKIKNILIPPQKNAKIKQHGNLKAECHPRDENLRQIRKIGRKKWKEAAGYHIRSLAETTMFRLKTILGDKLNARKLENQITEFLISASILNKMTALGMPDSYAAI